MMRFVLLILTVCVCSHMLLVCLGCGSSGLQVPEFTAASVHYEHEERISMEVWGSFGGLEVGQSVAYSIGDGQLTICIKSLALPFPHMICQSIQVTDQEAEPKPSPEAQEIFSSD